MALTDHQGKAGFAKRSASTMVRGLKASLHKSPSKVVRRQATLWSGRRQVKIRLIVALVGLALSFALAALAQQEDTVDPQVVQQLRELDRKTEDAYKKGDATARAALFTEDAVLVNQKGLFSGRQAIEAYYADLFTGAHFRHDPNGR